MKHITEYKISFDILYSGKKYIYILMLNAGKMTEIAEKIKRNERRNIKDNLIFSIKNKEFAGKMQDKSRNHKLEHVK